MVMMVDLQVIALGCHQRYPHVGSGIRMKFHAKDKISADKSKESYQCKL